jgi:quinol-cytochrome oxidoreductase complex cytochrome b subunit
LRDHDRDRRRAGNALHPVFLIVYAWFVFYEPNVLLNPDNSIPADPAVTPAHIVPEWYLLPFYAILRAIPNKLLRVTAMFWSIFVLFLVPWLDTWAAFVLAALAGSLLFISQATAYFASTTFWIKMSIMVLAGINMLIFEFITVRGVQEWDDKPSPPLPARLAGGISVTCWILVFIFGRWTGFTVLPE